ncbi:hypothetical protein [Psychromonas sp. MB-3u-54]|uniref:hypothetical protein n=1 Tax=Psychromonas sp. MB-3u-54 TaxID=2058319 RepID=UPI001E32953E|nr:hypothetical protein [Psychromonas sp. MB-3u-54]
MTDEIKQLKIYIESSVIEERNHIFKYTSSLTHPQSSQAKAVFLEYDRATSNDRYDNYHSNQYGNLQAKVKDIPSFYEFLTRKIRCHFNQNRKEYARDRILSPFNVYDEEGGIEDRLIADYEFSGDIDHGIFSSWLLFDHLFEIGEQIARRIETKNFIGIQSHLNIIDDNVGFLMDRKNSYFQLKMDEDELYIWLLVEIESFKHQIEEKGLWKSLKNEPEKHFQNVFAAVLGRVSELFGVDMSPEPSSGRGNVDFKFSQGNNSKVCVELKLSSSLSALEGYTRQLSQYLISEKINKGIYVVIDSGHSTNSYRKLLSFIEDGKKKGKSYFNIILMDANPKKSASKLR